MPRVRYSSRWSTACLVAGLMLVAGSASPEPVVDSARLNARLAKTPLAGLGEYFLSEGARVEKQQTLDPRLVVAIAGAESTFGAHICTPFNAWNWFWEGPCRPRRPDGSTPSPFSNWERGIAVVSKFLKKSYVLKGYTTIPQIGSKYCAVGCKHWAPLVTEFYTDLGGDLNDLAYPHGVPAPEGTEKPVDTPPLPPRGDTEKPTNTGPVAPPSSGATRGASSDVNTSPVGPPVSGPPDETGPRIFLWTALAIALAAVCGAAGFALGRRARQ